MYNNFITLVREIYNTPHDFIPLHEPRFIGNEKKYVVDAIDSTYVSSVGKYVDDFEKKLCEYTGAQYAVAIANGTSALHLALVLAGVQQGDEVITQALTFVATANAISYIKAIPHFVDVDVDTMGLSPKLLDNYLAEIAVIKNGICYNKNTGNKIAACVPMHTFGLPINIENLVAVCAKYGIPLIEDAAEAIGSFYKEKHLGTYGLLGAFSFNGNKTITSGGGGAIVTNSKDIAVKAKHLSTQAKIPHRWNFEHDAIAYNYRMPNLNAALLCAQMEVLPSFVENKRITTQKYINFFSTNPIAKFVTEIPYASSNYWLNAIVFNTPEEKDNFLQYTNDNGIMTRPIWQLMNDLKHFSAFPKANLDNSIYLVQRVVNIPSSVTINKN